MVIQLLSEVIGIYGSLMGLNQGLEGFFSGFDFCG